MLHISQWDLVCDKSALPEVSQTVLVSGMMIGALLFGFLLDMYVKTYLRPDVLPGVDFFFFFLVLNAKLLRRLRKLKGERAVPLLIVNELKAYRNQTLSVLICRSQRGFYSRSILTIKVRML